jgi:DNA-binding SARP family transcriptional activator/TolB-like protein
MRHDRGNIDRTMAAYPGRGLVVRLLGSMSVSRDGVPVALPRSRKVRALLAYLALSPQPVTRSRLCDLLWDMPSDPRGELRWCLSKLRSVLDDERRKRVVSDEDTVALDLSDCEVDTSELDAAWRAGIERVEPARLAALREQGDLLAGIEVDGSAELVGWLAGQRNRFRGIQIAVLAALTVHASGPDELFRRLEAWLRAAPLDPRAHLALVDALVAAGRPQDAEAHLLAAIRSFEQEGADWTPLRAGRKRETPRIEIQTPSVEDPPGRRRAAIAVMPFVEDGLRTRVADGLAEDIIMQLAKLRVLFVIARGTVFALADRGIEPHEAGRLLAVDYITTGSVHREGARITVRVELADARDGRIVWTDALQDDAFTLLDTIVERIVAAVAKEVEHAECQRAVLKSPSSLDAWEAYHRGLWHMYKFTRTDNREAHAFFHAAIDRDPMFARAYAGLSFTHFQNVFLDLTPDRDQQVELAFETANNSLGADDHDPAAHLAMGRALWLRAGSHDETLYELERCVELSPNFAIGHYTLGFVQAQGGDPHAAIAASNYSRKLSPFDPLAFGMYGSRGIAHIRLQEYEEASVWTVRATAQPNSHIHMLALAAVALELAERRDESRRFVGRVRGRQAGYNVEDLLRAFRFIPDVAKQFRHAARRIHFGT